MRNLFQKHKKILMGPNFLLVLYVHINNILSKVISFFINEDVFVVVIHWFSVRFN